MMCLYGVGEFVDCESVSVNQKASVDGEGLVCDGCRVFIGAMEHAGRR
jgi:hypothetical protein